MTMTYKPLSSGYTCLKVPEELGYPIRQSIESLEPLCDEVVISLCLPDQLSAQNAQDVNELKYQYNHPKFRFIRYVSRPWLGRWLNSILQKRAANKACTGLFKLGLDIGQQIDSKRTKKIHDRCVKMQKQLHKNGFILGQN